MVKLHRSSAIDEDKSDEPNQRLPIGLNERGKLQEIGTVDFIESGRVYWLECTCGWNTKGCCSQMGTRMSDSGD